MTPEPQRRQYLEAMGLTSWEARYRLPNARPTPACDWQRPEPVAVEAPGERLHALLDEAAREAPARPSPEPTARERGQRPAGPGKARALLGGGAPPDAAEAPAGVEAPERPAEPAEALRFTLQVACLDGRWLLLLPRERKPDTTGQRLLANLLQAAGVLPERPLDFETFQWPQMEGLPVDAPLEEARQGLQAFLEGRRRRGWAPERLLLFGHDATLATVLTVEGEHCALLDLPAWQGPSLDELAGSAEAKRALWPCLAGWREAWRDSSEDDDAAPAGG
ncbi:hypothetical protein QLQ85_10515 [Halomonas sp. M4R5S39]|uniref:hypothetical protein n=1 Tax=Halomonas kalidii TaxID=3043293 RepID=UPI0024A7DC7A|nr:hypothetical protein [Halomonas kalidii]MDI5985228.1 hypothetical protein [Halomonas kalidii]